MKSFPRRCAFVGRLLIRVLLTLLAPTLGNVAYGIDFPAGLSVAVSGLQLSKGRLVTVFLLGKKDGGGRRPRGSSPSRQRQKWRVYTGGHFTSRRPSGTQRTDDVKSKYQRGSSFTEMTLPSVYPGFTRAPAAKKHGC